MTDWPDQGSFWKLVLNGDVESVRSILNSEEELNRTGVPVVKWVDAKGQIALHLACMCGLVDMGLLLIEAGADYYFKADSGLTSDACVGDPKKRAIFKQKAFDVSPEGIIYHEQERIRVELEMESMERQNMMEADKFSFELEEYCKFLEDFSCQHHELARNNFIDMVFDAAKHAAGERIMANLAMEISEHETRSANAYARYLQDLEAEQARIAAIEAEKQREEQLAAAIEAAEVAAERARQHDAKMKRMEELRALRKEREEKRAHDEALARAEEERAKYAAYCKEMERQRQLLATRNIYDKPRRIRLYERMRMSMHMKACAYTGGGGSTHLDMKGYEEYRERLKPDSPDRRRTKSPSKMKSSSNASSRQLSGNNSTNISRNPSNGSRDGLDSEYFLFSDGVSPGLQNLSSLSRQSVSSSGSRLGKRYYKVIPPVQSLGIPVGRDNVSKYSKIAKKTKNFGSGKGIPDIDMSRPRTCPT